MQAPSKRMTAIPKGRPDHISLDYDLLRAEGVRHLEQLATEVWTDFNAHDPGITTVEVLCYAITDLAYRTRMLPIQDLAAGATQSKPWFEAQEILPSKPVTLNDLRRVLIDAEGVRNAWIEPAKPTDIVIKNAKGEKRLLKKSSAYRLREQIVASPSMQSAAELLKLVSRFLPEKLPDGSENPAFTSMVKKVSAQLEDFPLSSESEQETWIQNLGDEEHLDNIPLANAICCEYLYPLITSFVPNPEATDETAHPDHALPLNGLYRVRIQLDDHLDPDNAKHLQRALRQALARLNDNRPLCEDFLRPEPVEQWPYCLCIDIETDPAVDERAIAAEILYRIQEHLVPSVRFRTFREMRQLGIPCEQIFNGPLLRNGFLAEAELQASRHLPRYIYRSELMRIAADVPGVLDVRDLRFKGPNHSTHSEAWQIPVVPITHKFEPPAPPYPTDPDAADYPPGYLKPTLDACCSHITIWRNGLHQVLTGTTLDEPYQALRIARMGLSTDKPGGPEPPIGILRPDLSEYHSIQYDYPANYRLGDNLPSPQRWASTRQMQAYLLFYDQLLAGYLMQLGQVRDLFSVRQDTTAPTYTLPGLFQLPGAQDLMGEFAHLTVPPSAASAAGAVAEQQALLLDQDMQQLQVALAKADTEALKATLRKSIEENRRQAAILRQTEAKLQPLTGKVFEKMSLLKAALRDTLGEQYDTFGGICSNAVWQAFTQDPQNNITQAIAAIADPPARRMDRRNRLLDHLIARFGEAFSDYVATLVRADAAPEDNPWRQDFEEYLHDKARFLETLPETTSERGRGYNYRLLNGLHQPDVWNSTNVAGLHKRVSRLLGIDNIESRSLIGTPPFRLDIVKRSTRQGSPVYHINLVRRDAEAGTEDNPLRRGALLSSKPFAQEEEVKKAHTSLLLSIQESQYLQVKSDPENDDLSRIVFDNGSCQLISRSLPEPEILELQAALLDLLGPRHSTDREGFHLIEHILLRPDDEADQLLQIPLGCDPLLSPHDPYSFWLTVVLPDWPGRFHFPDFRRLVEQTFRREAPAHIALRFCWLDRDDMLAFELILRKWLEEKARCEPNNCNVSGAANNLIQWLNDHPCTCTCDDDQDAPSACA